MLTNQLSLHERAAKTTHPLNKRLFNLMEQKKSNLAVAADVRKSRQLLDIAKSLGSSICILKTHIDILDDFTCDVTKELLQIAEANNFLVFEDRKFADIGNTVAEQYSGGIYRICDWAHLVNAHPLPGPGVIEGLLSANGKKMNGLLLVAELSSKGNLIDNCYRQQALEMAISYKDFVTGFICQHKISDDPSFVHITPGVNLSAKSDSLGQQYITPEEAITQRGSDIIIVGRDIINAPNPRQKAEEYRQIAWHYYA